jgi:hypothetical protein
VSNYQTADREGHGLGYTPEILARERRDSHRAQISDLTAYGNGCDDCFGLGAAFEHLSSCESDFCVGNGDEHSCNGTWVPCYRCGIIRGV